MISVGHGTCRDGICVAAECFNEDVMVDGVCLPTATTCVDRGMSSHYSSIGNITCYTRDTCNIEPSECFDYGNGFEYCDNLADMGYPGVLCGGGLCDNWGAVDCFIWDPCWEPPEVMEGHTYNNSCEEDTIDNCGKHGYKCPSVDHGTVKCDSGICYVDSCETGYYISDSWPETCVRDETWCDGDLEYCHGACIDVFWDNNNCGGCDVKCGAYSSCEDGTCIFSGYGSCSDEYVMVEGVCIPTAMTCVDRGVNPYYSTNTNITCLTSETCNAEPTACFDFTLGYEYCDNLDEKGYYGVYCGADSCEYLNEIDCFIWDPCWSPPEVMKGHSYNNSCEADSVRNCGKHGYKCPNVEHGKVGCGSGTCYVESCEAGYHITESWPEKCEPD